MRANRKLFVLGVLFALLVGLFVMVFLHERTRLNNEVMDATVCQLQSNPDAYRFRLVKVNGRVSRGFEDATFTDSACPPSIDEAAVWFEYGGRRQTGTMYCCNVSAEKSRKKPLVVDGYETSLLENAELNKLELHLQTDVAGYAVSAKATVIGRFFSDQLRVDDRKLWGGYGHMGAFSLLVVQEVVSVEP